MPTFLSNNAANAGVHQVSLGAVVLRCTCTADQKAAPAWHGARGIPCPQAKQVPLGDIAYWHRNPIKRLVWRCAQWMRGLVGARNT